MPLEVIAEERGCSLQQCKIFLLCFSSGMVGGTVLQKISANEWFSEPDLCLIYCQCKNWELVRGVQQHLEECFCIHINCVFVEYFLDPLRKYPVFPVVLVQVFV